MAKILDGKSLAASIREELRDRIAKLKSQGVTPGLAAILVGNDPASAVYVRNKRRACEEAGIISQLFALPATTSQAELLSLIEGLNEDSTFHGILVQMPLPSHLDAAAVISAVSPLKDIDGLHPENAGRLLMGEPRYVPCTPAGVHQILLRHGYSPEGKHVVICGRSNLVGKPLAMLLLLKRSGANATVTLCHTGTPNLPRFTKDADILVAAAGSPRLIRGDMVREGAVVVDVGVNRVADPSTSSGYRLVGDVAFEEVEPVAEAISPVPGGVGPMTIAMLLVNTVQAAEEHSEAHLGGVR